VKKGLQIIGMPVVGIKEGIECGTVKGFAVDAQSKKISSVILKGDKNEFDLRMLKVTDILNAGKDFIVTKTSKNVKDMGYGGDLLVLLGMKCVSGTGDVIGKVKDFDFDEKSGEIASLQLDSDTEIEGKEILTISGELMFLSNEITFEEKNEEAESSDYEKEQRQYLLGKTVQTDILDSKGKTLIEKGTKITDAVIEKAKKDRLITEMTMNVE
jgi:sporulation protein YlmC with PRC-barrel domain